MKQKIHPLYRKVVFRDVNTNDYYIIGSTAVTTKTITLADGIEYPLVNVEVSAASHPFYTGKQRDTAIEGRIQKFNAKYGLE